MFRPLRMTRADAQEMIGPESLHLYVLDVKKRNMSPRVPPNPREAHHHLSQSRASNRTVTPVVYAPLPAGIGGTRGGHQPCQCNHGGGAVPPGSSPESVSEVSKSMEAGGLGARHLLKRAQHKTTKSFDDIACVGESHSLSEISLDGNPFSQEPQYKQTVLRHMQQLRQLDMKRVSDDERRIASVMARKEEEKKRETTKVHVMKERRRLAINNARRQWDVMQGSLMVRTNKLVRTAMPDLVASHVGNIANNDLTDDREEDDASSGSRPTSAKSIISERDATNNTSRPGSHGASRGATPDKDKMIISGPVGSNSSLNVDYLAELEGDTLSLYGPGALEALDKNWGMAAAGAVTTIVFKFVDYDEVCKHFHKVRARFPSTHTFSFASTNICSLQQLNALSALRRLDHLMISAEGNPVTQFVLWRPYILFRLAHFALKKINDADITAADIVNAEKFFGPLAHITTSQLPQSRLVSLLGESKRKQLLTLTEDKLRKSPETKLTDRTAIESVGRAGLSYATPEQLKEKLQEVQSRSDFVGSYMKELTIEAVSVDQKRTALQKAWPTILEEMIQSSVLDMWDMSSYMKRCLDELEKS